jgi:hypothetical protein
MRCLPPKSKLIFELEILEFTRVSAERMTDAELYYEVYHNMDLAEKHLRRREEQRALDCLGSAYSFAKRIRNHRGIQSQILLKWGNVLFYRGEYEDALAVVLNVDRQNSQYL